MANKEYVDKESLAKHIDSCFSEISTPFHVRAIRNFPAADNVVEVVRCKDCKHYGGVAYGFVCCFHSGLNYRICTHEDDFCSYGRRRNEKREEERILSERQEKKKRKIQRMQYLLAVYQWSLQEPFPLLIWRWIKWKRNKPKLEDFKVKE